MSYINDLDKFYENFSTWRIKGLGLEYRYLILISKAKPMKDIIERVRQEARTFVNETHIRDNSGIFGSVSFFSTSIAEDVLLYEMGNSCGTKQRVLNQLGKPPSCTGGDNIWSSIANGLKALRGMGTDGMRKKGRILVFTQGYDIEGDFGEEDIVRHNKEGIKNISKMAQRYRIPIYLIALPRSEDDEWFWNILRRAAIEASSKTKWVTVTVLAEVDEVRRQFKQHHKDIQQDILKVCTLENFAWRFLAKEFPPPRWYLYPGLALCMYLEQKRVGEEGLHGPSEEEVVISLADLKQTFSNFIEDIVDQETVASAIQAYVEIRSLDKERYRKWITQDKFIENYVDLVIDTMLKAGWIHELEESGGSNVVVQRPSGPDKDKLIMHLMDNYFLTEAWDDPEEFTKERPRLKRLMKTFFNGTPQPLISQGDLEAAWAL